MCTYTKCRVMVNEYTNTLCYHGINYFLFIKVPISRQHSSTNIITSPSTEETTPSSSRTTTLESTNLSPKGTASMPDNNVKPEPTTTPEHKESYKTGNDSFVLPL